MLKISLLFTHQTLTAPTTAGLTEYRKRLSKSCQLNWTTGASASNPAMDGQSRAQIILLDRNGQTLTSPQLAQQIQLWSTQGKSHLVWVLGDLLQTPVNRDPHDPKGPSGSCLESTTDHVYRLSLSPLSLSADVAGLLTAEQIYRAFRILENQPYHK